jgi:hypothetical protein
VLKVGRDSFLGRIRAALRFPGREIILECF